VGQAGNARGDCAAAPGLEEPLPAGQWGNGRLWGLRLSLMLRPQGMRDFFETVEVRQSIRAYQARPLEPGQLEQILRAVQRAPSAGNLQAFEVVVVRDPVTIRALAVLCYNQMFIAQAPVVLVFCADPARSAARYGAKGEALYSVQDATIAAAYAELAVAALGLGTCWIGAFDEEELARRLKLRPGLRPVALFPIGWPAEQPQRTSRRPLEEMVHEYRP